jgi:hypothetical protein
LMEVTTQVTNHNLGGTSKSEGTSVAGAGAKVKATVKPSNSRTGRLPLGVVAGTRERTA